MTKQFDRGLFVNVAVRDLQRTIAYFTELGFTFNPKFTDEKAACLVIGEISSVMLLQDSFFSTFTKKPTVDARQSTQAIIAVSCESRDEVNRIVDRAVVLGGTAAGDPMDHGFMYMRSFFDLDGHHWEMLWMDPAQT